MTVALAILWKQAPNPYVKLAFVGDIKVALVQYPSPEMESNDYYVMILLPDMVKSDEVWRKSEAAAKKYVEDQVQAWFNRTGLLL
jgi:hypothetical protein